MGKQENDNTAQSEKIFDKVGDIFEVSNWKISQIWILNIYMTWFCRETVFYL